MTDKEIIEDFYESMTQKSLSKVQEQKINDLLNRMNRGEEA